MSVVAGSSRRFVAVVAVAVVAVAVAVIGPWAYINVIAGEPPTAFEIVEGSAWSDEAIDVDGRWQVADGSGAGYRVEKRIAGQRTEAVGRTEQISGGLVIDEARIVEGRFVVEMATVVSGEPRRDAAFRDWIMSTGSFPEATLTIEEPLYLHREARRGARVSAPLAGVLEIRGQRRSVEFAVEAKLVDESTIEVVATHVAAFADWGIENPSPPGVIVVEEAAIEVFVVLRR
jgi:hypothetical protein